MKYIISILLIVILQFASDAQKSPKTISASADLKLIQITNHTWIHISVETINGFGRVSSNGVIYTQNGKAFLLDTPVTDSLTAVLVGVIKDSLKAKVVGFVPNHWHEDCMGGLKYLQSLGIKSYANRLTINEAKKRKLPVPAKGFKDSLQINMDGKPIDCWYPGGGHTKDNIVVWLPEEKVLFAGCMCKEMESKGLGNLSDAELENWPGTIDKVISKYKNAEFVVPGHGQWGGTELLKHTRELVIKKN